MHRPTERSFRVIYPPVGGQPPRFQFPVLPDRFHTPYPTSAQVYLRQEVVRHDVDNLFHPPSPEDHITQLPAEIFDMIFSTLSVADLDASRYVCHRWWDKIMGSSEVLSQVLRTKSALSPRSLSDGSLDSWIRKWDDLRQLARRLDHGGSALSLIRLEGSWRSRYRRCRMEFSFFNYFEVEEKACPPDYLNHTFSSASFSSTGKFSLFVVRGAVGSAEAGSQANVVLFYHISWSGRPVYISSIPGPGDDTVIDAVHLSGIEQGRSWMGIVEIGESSLQFSIKLRQGWLNTCSPYILTPLIARENLCHGWRMKKAPKPE